MNHIRSRQSCFAEVLQLRIAQFDSPGAGFPIPPAKPTALGQPQRGLLATGSTGEGAPLQIHQPPGGKTDHPAKEIGIRRHFHEAEQEHNVIGNLKWQSLGLWSRPDPTGHTGDQRKQINLNSATSGALPELVDQQNPYHTWEHVTCIFLRVIAFIQLPTDW